VDRMKAISFFRKERLEEPLEDYLEAFDVYQGYVEEFLETTVDLTQLDSQALEVLTDPNLLEAFRYLAAPPISEDDLKVLAEAPSLAKGQLRQKPEDVQRLLQTVRLVLDQRSFSWVLENREPTEAERRAAVMASAALLAASRVQTKRRSTGKAQQEALVTQALKDLDQGSGRAANSECHFGSRGGPVLRREHAWRAKSRTQGGHRTPSLGPQAHAD
jgi:hypothetical protein